MLNKIAITLALSVVSLNLIAAEHPTIERTDDICVGFGPQAPRDIDNPTGTNHQVSSFAPNHTEMNLCDIHFHSNAEHKDKAFAIYAGEGDHGHGGGYKCAIGESLTKAELQPFANNYCKGVKSGDTIEVHWVYTTCDVKPDKGLDSCFSAACKIPSLRVESQVFTVVNDKSALNFNDYTYAGHIANGYYQTKALPTNTGTPVEFIGSSTGPKYNEHACSPYQISWSVRPQCAKVDINSLSEWCKSNTFGENAAHGVRHLVTTPSLLSKIK